MTTPTPVDEKLDFLKRIGAITADHSGATLIDHLLGVRAILERWDARPALCDAGLFHSVYGTQSYRTGLVDRSQRTVVAETIGEEAEAIAYLFGVMNTRAFWNAARRTERFGVVDVVAEQWVAVQRERFADLANLFLANQLEQEERLGDLGLPAGPEPLQRLLLPAAWAEIEARATRKRS